MWFSRHLLRAPPGERLREQRPGLLHPQEVVLVGRLPVGVGGEIIIESTFRSSFRKSRTSGCSSRSRWLKKVEFVVTRKPRAFAPPGWHPPPCRTRLPRTPTRRGARADRRCAPPTRSTATARTGRALLHQQGVGAQVDELLALHQLLGDEVDLGVDERLAPGDRDHRRPALLDRGDRLLDAHPLLEDAGRVLDLPAAGAGQVAGEQRLQLDHQGNRSRPLQPLAGQIPATLMLCRSGTDIASITPSPDPPPRSSTGSVKRMDSSITCRCSTSTGPRPPARPDHAVDQALGSGRPGRHPDRVRPGSHASSIWPSSSIRTRTAPLPSATSTRRREFE